MKYQSALEKREPDTITKTWKSFQYWVSEFKKARGKG